MWILSLTASFAGEPVISTDDSGVVRATALVAAPPADALKLIRDPLAIHALSSDEGALKSQPDGDCFALSYERSSPFGVVTYRARACPTASGMRSDLVQSDSFRSMTSVWTVKETAQGTEISYLYDADLSIAVPSFLVRRSTESAITKMMARIVARLGPR